MVLNDFQDACLAKNNRKSNLKANQDQIIDLEKTVALQDAHITKKHEKNLKAFQEMNVDISAKDRRIMELHKEVKALTDKVNWLSSQLQEAKSIMMHTYRSGFNEAVKQA